jgi:UDP-N-acetylmuramoyl-tripeptide--D-alanyl-D-alanine ligase
MRLTIDRAVRATGGRLLESTGAPLDLCISADTRSIRPGDAFVALRGERFDGHVYIGEAVRRGAAMLIVDNPEARVAGTPTLLVGRTHDAYLALAAAARELFRGQVVGITGSTGKTTTKRFLTQLLAARYGERVLAAPGNENNEIGVSKLLLGASNERHDVVVVEMGARHYGDIAQLVAIARPTVGILTNVGEAHLEIMGSRERLEETKWALFARGARAVLNAADDASRRRAGSLAHAPHWFTAASDELERTLESGRRITALIDRSRLLESTGGKTVVYEVDVRVPGEHNRANLAGAVAGALELEVPLDELLPVIPSIELPEGRYHAIEAGDGLRLIYDAYNASATGMIAALDAFAEETAARRIAVLGSMAELGEESERLHELVGAHAAARVDVLLAGGDFAAALTRGAQRGGLAASAIVHVEDNAEAADWLREHAQPDDVVLLKGSRRYRLEEIPELLGRTKREPRGA